MKKVTFYLFVLILILLPLLVNGEVLEVKEGKTAIIKQAPTSDAPKFSTELPAGTRVNMISKVPYYYEIQCADGLRGWSYKGYFVKVDGADTIEINGETEVTKEVLLSRSDLLKIVIIDVEVGDATLIFCPFENGRRDIILIDTGEDDADRIKNELISNGFSLVSKPISRFIITHYDTDHCGDAAEIVPYSEIIYDHGNNNVDSDYLYAVSQSGIDRRTMTLDYQETFSGGVSIECVAVNQATDFDRNYEPTTPNDNANSIALVVSYEGFDYFTGGDLTHKPEKSLAKGIQNCDAYHVNHHGSKATSSHSDFVKKLDPEVSIASNGTKHGHPTSDVAQRLIVLGSQFYQTNKNLDSRAHQPADKFIADDTYNDDNEEEELEGAKGTINIVVDADKHKYYVVMPDLPLSEATIEIEN